MSDEAQRYLKDVQHMVEGITGLAMACKGLHTAGMEYRHLQETRQALIAHVVKAIDSQKVIIDYLLEGEEWRLYNAGSLVACGIHWDL